MIHHSWCTRVTSSWDGTRLHFPRCSSARYSTADCEIPCEISRRHLATISHVIVVPRRVYALRRCSGLFPRGEKWTRRRIKHGNWYNTRNMRSDINSKSGQAIVFVKKRIAFALCLLIATGNKRTVPFRARSITILFDVTVKKETLFYFTFFLSVLWCTQYAITERNN